MKNEESSGSPLRQFARSLPESAQRMILRAEHISPLVAQARAGKVAGVLTEGLGMNFPPLFQEKQDDAFPDSEDDWQRLLKHVDWLGLKILRYWLLGTAAVNEQGELQRDHKFFARLRRLDAWAQQRGVRLILDLSAMPVYLRCEIPESEPNVHHIMAAPADANRFVEEFALPIVKHVVQDLKLEAVRYLNLVNEPFNVDLDMDTFYTPPGVDPFARYVEINKTLRRRMDEEGIDSQRLGLVGPDNHDNFVGPLAEMKRRGLDLLSHVAIMDEHAYRMRFDYLPESHHAPTITMSELIESLRPSVAVARAAGKPYVLTEYSSFYYASPDGPLRHESTITEAEFVVRMLAEGANGALRYSLVNSGETDGRWQCVVTTDGWYQPSPNIYYAFAVLSRYAPRGGQLRPLEITAPQGREAYIHGVVIDYPAPAGSGESSDFTVLVVNDHPGEIIALEYETNSEAALFAWQTDDAHKHGSITPIRENGRVALTLPPLSVTALTTFDLKPEAPGLIEQPA